MFFFAIYDENDHFTCVGWGIFDKNDHFLDFALNIGFLVKKGALGGKKGVFGKNLDEKPPILGKHVVYWEKGRNRGFSGGVYAIFRRGRKFVGKSSWEKGWECL